ncbi:MAG: extracellular solute-binding protein [Eubacteriales bacterium]|nr:extracellular solute-binding protein [Eubacteriales bacterium]
MKKSIALLLTAMLLLGMCATVFAAEEETLTVWCWDPNFNIYAMQEAEKIYQKDHPNFKLNIVEKAWDDVQTGITTAAGGDMSILPDIMLVQDMAFRKNVANFPEVFADITESGIAFDKFSPSKVGYSVVDGKNYGVPFDNGAAIAAYRTDILEQAGFKASDLNDITWTRFIEIGKEVLAKTGVPMFAYSPADADFLTMLLQSMGTSMFTEDGKVNLNNNPGIHEMIKIYKELRDAGIYVEVQNWDEYCRANVTGGCVGTIQGCWFIGTLTSAPELEGKWAIVNAPKAEIEGASNYTANGGSSWAITSNAKNKELAADFLAKTFAGSVELYDTILEKAGAIATYLPAADSDVYGKEQAFFGGQKVYQDIVNFGSKIPTITIGVYHYEARNALSIAVQEIVNGAEEQAALDKAQQDVEFNMGL